MAVGSPPRPPERSPADCGAPLTPSKAPEMGAGPGESLALRTPCARDFQVAYCSRLAATSATDMGTEAKQGSLVTRQHVGTLVCSLPGPFRAAPRRDASLTGEPTRLHLGHQVSSIKSSVGSRRRFECMHVGLLDPLRLQATLSILAGTGTSRDRESSSRSIHPRFQHRQVRARPRVHGPLAS